MKKLLIIILITLTFFARKSSAQTFAPGGATWHYSEGFAFSGDIKYVKYTSEKDTILKGVNCRKITKNHDYMCYGRPDFELMYATNDSVFFYDRAFDSFQMLYNFNATKGYKWHIIAKKYPNTFDTIFLKVDSTGTMMANNQLLKVQYVLYHLNGNTAFENRVKIIEKMGNENYMFDFYSYRTEACDANYPKGLRCYEDTIIGNYHFANMDSCEYTYNWTGINPITDNNIIIYPNPTNETIYITGLNQTANFQMYDINGRLVKSGNLKDAQIQLKELVNGMYVLNICDLTGLKLINKKISKN